MCTPHPWLICSLVLLAGLDTSIQAQPHFTVPLGDMSPHMICSLFLGEQMVVGPRTPSGFPVPLLQVCVFLAGGTHPHVPRTAAGPWHALGQKLSFYFIFDKPYKDALVRSQLCLMLTE